MRQVGAGFTCTQPDPQLPSTERPDAFYTMLRQNTSCPRRKILARIHSESKYQGCRCAAENVQMAQARASCMYPPTSTGRSCVIAVQHATWDDDLPFTVYIAAGKAKARSPWPATFQVSRREDNDGGTSLKRKRSQTVDSDEEDEEEELVPWGFRHCLESELESRQPSRSIESV